MSIYLNLLSEKNIDKASKIQKDMQIPSPSDLFDFATVEKEGWTEDECI